MRHHFGCSLLMFDISSEASAMFLVLVLPLSRSLSLVPWCDTSLFSPQHLPFPLCLCCCISRFLSYIQATLFLCMHHSADCAERWGACQFTSLYSLIFPPVFLHLHSVPLPHSIPYSFPFPLSLFIFSLFCPSLSLHLSLVSVSVLILCNYCHDLQEKLTGALVHVCQHEYLLWIKCH